MSKLIPAALLVGIITVFAVLRPVQGQSDFVLERADGRRDIGMSMSSTLTGNLASVAERIVLVYTNGRRDIAMLPLPAAMRSVVNQVAERIVLVYANGRRDIAMTPPPETFTNYLKRLLPRFVIQYANGRRDLVMTYPRELLNDTTRPQVLDIEVLTDGGLRVRWTTNEFTRGKLQYGTTSGSYTGTIEEQYYEKQHELVLPSVSPGAVLYFRLIVTDQSGNETVTPEQVVQGLSYLYLPTVRKRW